MQGASRFVQRLWRLVNESAEIAKAAPAARPASFGADALALRKAAHGALDKVSAGIERLHFNVCLAHIREFTNALADVLGARGPLHSCARFSPLPGQFRRPRSFLFNCSRP